MTIQSEWANLIRGTRDRHFIFGQGYVIIGISLFRDRGADGKGDTPRYTVCISPSKKKYDPGQRPEGEDLTTVPGNSIFLHFDTPEQAIAVIRTIAAPGSEDRWPDGVFEELKAQSEEAPPRGEVQTWAFKIDVPVDEDNVRKAT